MCIIHKAANRWRVRRAEVRGKRELKEQKISLPPAPFVPSAHLSSVYLHLRVERKIKKAQVYHQQSKGKINKVSECCSPRLFASVITLTGGVGNKGFLPRMTRSTGHQTDDGVALFFRDDVSSENRVSITPQRATRFLNCRPGQRRKTEKITEQFKMVFSKDGTCSETNKKNMVLGHWNMHGRDS